MLEIKSVFLRVGCVLILNCVVPRAGAAAQEHCPGDTSGDFRVDVVDLMGVLAQWGVCAGCEADFDDNGVVDTTDLLLLLGAWGECRGNPAALGHCVGSLFDPDVCFEAVGAAMTVDFMAESCMYVYGEFEPSPCSWAGAVGYCTMLPGETLEQREYFYAPAFTQATARARCNPDESTNEWTPLP